MIDNKTQEFLRQKYNPEGSVLRNTQMRLLEMLKYVDGICKENDIKYWLSSGTCLGAVRHGGFIPWDDDLDIEMLWADYKKFVKIVNSHNGKDGFVVQTASNDPYYFYPFGKLRDLNSQISEVHGLDKQYKYRGYFIDIFPIEPAGSRIFHLAMAALLGKTTLYTSRRIIPIFISKKILYNIIYEGLSKVNRVILSHIKTNRYRHIIGHTCLKIRMLNEIFPLSIMKFEDCEFPVPNNTDGYLKKFYDNYYDIPTFDNIHIHTIESTVGIQRNRLDLENPQY